MSYILAALKKADQEREIGAVPNLATPAEVTPPPARSYRWPWIIAALLSANIVLVVWLLKDRGVENAPAPVVEQAQPAQPAGAANVQPSPAVQPSGEGLSAAAQTAGQQGQAMQPAGKDLPTTAQAAEEPAPAEMPPAVPSGGLVVLPEPAYLHNSGPSLPQEEGADMQMNAAANAQENSQLPSWYDLSPEFRKGLDLPRLDIHVYSDQPENRFIMVELKKYREGQSLASGLKLEEILPDGMVMSYRGERFRVEK